MFFSSKSGPHAAPASTRGAITRGRTTGLGLRTAQAPRPGSGRSDLERAAGPTVRAATGRETRRRPGPWGGAAASMSPARPEGKAFVVRPEEHARRAAPVEGHNTSREPARPRFDWMQSLPPDPNRTLRPRVRLRPGEVGRGVADTEPGDARRDAATVRAGTSGTHPRVVRPPARAAKPIGGPDDSGPASIEGTSQQGGRTRTRPVPVFRARSSPARVVTRYSARACNQRRPRVGRSARVGLPRSRSHRPGSQTEPEPRGDWDPSALGFQAGR